MEGAIISCYGCGAASCSMCCVWDAKNEAEAISKFTSQYGPRKTIELILKYLYYTKYRYQGKR